MYVIQNIGNQPLQDMTLILPNGNPASLTLYFMPMQTGWFIRTLTYQGFTLNGVRIVNSPNILYAYKNIIPFGFGCFSTQNDREPSQQNDFSSGANVLFLLSQSEVESMTEIIQSG